MILSNTRSREAQADGAPRAASRPLRIFCSITRKIAGPSGSFALAVGQNCILKSDSNGGRLRALLEQNRCRVRP